MTDTYMMTIRALDDDRITLHIGLMYPYVSAPGGFGFSRMALQSLVEQLNQPEHPYLQALAEPDIPPGRLIRAVQIDSCWVDEDSAQALSECTIDAQPFTETTDWLITICVRLPSWLEGLTVGMWEDVGFQGTVGDETTHWWDDHNTSDEDGYASYWDRSYQEFFEEGDLIHEMVHACFHGGYSPLRCQDDGLEEVEMPHLLSEFDMEEAIGFMYPFTPFARFYSKTAYEREQWAMLCRAHPGTPWSEAQVIVNDDRGDMPQYRLGSVFGNIAHFVDHYLSKALNDVQDDPVLHQMLTLDRQRLARWASDHNMSLSWTTESAYVAFFDQYCTPEALEEAKKDVFDFEFVFDTLFCDFYHLQPLEQEQTLRTFRVYEQELVRRCLTDGEDYLMPILIDHGYAMFLFFEPNAQLHAHVERYLRRPRRWHDEDDVLKLFAALLRDADVSMVDTLMSLVTQDNAPIDVRFFKWGIQTLRDLEKMHLENPWPKLSHVDALCVRLEKYIKAQTADG